jgi:hypothetical protein
MATNFRRDTRAFRKLACARELALCWFLVLSTSVLIAAAYRVGIARGLDSYVAPMDTEGCQNRTLSSSP